MGLRLRDRDYIVGLNGLIFRVLGYTHPPDGYVCDLEYVPSHFYRSVNPKAPRGFRVASHYKLYGDEPFKLVKERFPEYRVFYKPLSINLPGVPLRLMKEVRLPTVGLKRLLESEKDELTEALRELLNRVLDSSGLKPGDFGVFGSLLFGFYHPMLSDIDLVVYGSSNLRELRDCLSELYREGFMVNEFTKPPKALNWRFTKYPLNLFLKHQRRKLVYAVYRSPASGRAIKVEFEPVKGYDEITDEYRLLGRIVRLGWFKGILRVLNDQEAAFMPSVYGVELESLLDGPKVDSVSRVVSYVEEYRLQAFKGERVYVEGWLERVETSDGELHQVTLTYGPRYYDQTLYSLELDG